ncbi:hypothetical protein PFISCL1PPCAC_18946 [Pristionchus fissidentatus]|uniref:F-box domain-containing protein n=1 Tax=Pristionchus fissidentatus TaxID=1538716 RepID=A0AAV5W6R2_9BILA|nr:hypothetical protein PFISCL1PPCAC_18946 [Pristionchus fissidentatus]
MDERELDKSQYALFQLNGGQHYNVKERAREIRQRLQKKPKMEEKEPFPLLKLPTELILHFLSLLPLRDRFTMRLTNRFMDKMENLVPTNIDSILILYQSTPSACYYTMQLTRKRERIEIRCNSDESFLLVNELRRMMQMTKFNKMTLHMNSAIRIDISLLKACMALNVMSLYFVHEAIEDWMISKDVLNMRNVILKGDCKKKTITSTTLARIIKGMENLEIPLKSFYCAVNSSVITPFLRRIGIKKKGRNYCGRQKNMEVFFCSRRSHDDHISGMIFHIGLIEIAFRSIHRRTETVILICIFDNEEKLEKRKTQIHAGIARIGN